eukprot:scaffold6077_cov18-Tisochrysis_lutea.AAC.4
MEIPGDGFALEDTVCTMQTAPSRRREERKRKTALETKPLPTLLKEKGNALPRQYSGNCKEALDSRPRWAPRPLQQEQNAQQQGGRSILTHSMFIIHVE